MKSLSLFCALVFQQDLAEVFMDHNFGHFYNYLAYLSTIKYGTERDIKLSPNPFSFLYKKAKSSQLKCVIFLPTQFRVFSTKGRQFTLLVIKISCHLNFPTNQYSFREITTKYDQQELFILIYWWIQMEFDQLWYETFMPWWFLRNNIENLQTMDIKLSPDQFFAIAFKQEKACHPN